MRVLRDLPVELQRLVYEYDNTYHDYFSKNVLPELETNFWKRIFFRLTVGILNFTAEEWEVVSDISDADTEEEMEYENMFM